MLLAMITSILTIQYILNLYSGDGVSRFDSFSPSLDLGGRFFDEMYFFYLILSYFPRCDLEGKSAVSRVLCFDFFSFPERFLSEGFTIMCISDMRNLLYVQQSTFVVALLYMVVYRKSIGL